MISLNSKGALVASDYKVSAFTDPIAALALIQKNLEKYNLLVSDFSMKTSNGCDLAIRIKELNDKIKVILLLSIKYQKTPLT